MKFPLAILIVLYSLSCFSQVSNQDFKYLIKKNRVSIENKKGKLSIVTENYEQAKFLSSDMLFLAKKSIPYDKFRSIENLKAATISETGQRKTVDYFETKDQLGGITFYSDNKLKEFTFPNVKEGSIIETRYDEVFSNEMPFSTIFTFSSYFSVDHAELTVEFSKDVEIGYKVFNGDDLEVHFEQTEEKKSHVYRWTAQRVEGVRIDDDQGNDYESRMYYIPHLVVYVKSYIDANGQKIKVLDGVENLYSWYSSLIDRIEEQRLSEVHTIAENLVEGETTSKGKAQRIFQWVQDNISYVAFGDGFGGFVPRGAASICDKKYGDCKDMSHLLYVMLNHVGIDAYHAWIGSRRKPYTYVENPTPFVDNHMICMAVIDGDSVFLDATDSNVEFGYPSSFIQGKESLVGISESQFIIKKVEEVEASKNTTVVESDAYLENGVVKVSESRKLKGLTKEDFTRSYIREKDDKTEEEFLNNKLKLGNNKTRYDNIVFQGLSNKDSLLDLSYDLSISNYFREISNKIYINMNFDRSLSEEYIDVNERKYGKKIHNQFESNFTTRLSIPEGYTLEKVPSKSSYDGGDFSYEISYKLDNDEIIQTKKLQIKTLHIEPARFAEWNSFIQKLISEYKRNLVLIPNT